MQRRVDIWRKTLMGSNVEHKRHLYEKFIQGSDDISESLRTTIEADMPRTYANKIDIQSLTPSIQKILVEYASIHKGDSYLQGFNYMVAILFYVFKDSEHVNADVFWCFSAIVGRIRPMIPDFNLSWFEWCRRHWMSEFHKRLQKKRPALDKLLSRHSETLSSLLPCKWFMIWFTQTVDFDEIFELWDFFIQLPPQHLMMAYILFAYEIFQEAAPVVTYQWSVEPTNLLHTVLSLRVKKIGPALERVRKNF